MVMWCATPFTATNRLFRRTAYGCCDENSSHNHGNRVIVPTPTLAITAEVEGKPETTGKAMVGVARRGGVVATLWTWTWTTMGMVVVK